MPKRTILTSKCNYARSLMHIKVVGRQSPLSKVQIEEVLLAIKNFHPSLFFEKILMETTGDKDLLTPLSSLDKTNFFTKEIDEALLQQEGRIAIHSAKDLPQNLEKGLTIVAITQGIDKRDSLVLREGDCLKSLKKGACIGASSTLRQKAILNLREDFQIKEIRGTIGARLEQLSRCKFDGVVIAEAALIRLQLTHLNRLILEGETTALQGQLAILAREDDQEMQELFSCLDSR